MNKKYRNYYRIACSLLVVLFILACAVVMNRKNKVSDTDTMAEQRIQDTETMGNAEAGALDEGTALAHMPEFAEAKEYRQSDGGSDEFFKQDLDKKVGVRFGKQEYDISHAVSGWEFGEPVINLQELADIMGLTFTLDVPQDFLVHPRYEEYADGDEIDLSKRADVFLVSKNGGYVRYTITSTFTEDSYGNARTHLRATTLGDDGFVYISGSMIPFYDGSVLKTATVVGFEYQEEKTIVVVTEE